MGSPAADLRRDNDNAATDTRKQTRRYVPKEYFLGRYSRPVL
jgi:hypothetical protein